MEKRPHLLRRYDLYKGCHPQRLDHFNVFAAEVQDTVDFYARLGFRLTEYAEEDGDNGRIAAAWMHRSRSFSRSAAPWIVSLLMGSLTNMTAGRGRIVCHEGFCEMMRYERGVDGREPASLDVPCSSDVNVDLMLPRSPRRTTLTRMLGSGMSYTLT